MNITVDLSQLTFKRQDVFFQLYYLTAIISIFYSLLCLLLSHRTFVNPFFFMIEILVKQASVTHI
jgi:hypothetical protein